MIPISINRAVAKTGGTYVGAEVLQGVTLDGVDAQLGVGLNDGKATRDCRCETVSCFARLEC